VPIRRYSKESRRYITPKKKRRAFFQVFKAGYLEGMNEFGCLFCFVFTKRVFVVAPLYGEKQEQEFFFFFCHLFIFIFQFPSFFLFIFLFFLFFVFLFFSSLLFSFLFLHPWENNSTQFSSLAYFTRNRWRSYRR